MNVKVMKTATLTTSMEFSWIQSWAGDLAMQVCCRVPVGKCVSQEMIKTRWVDTYEGDERSPEIRFWLVAKEVKKRNNTQEESANFFASTPLLAFVKFFDFGSHDQESFSKQPSVEDEFH